MPAALRAALLLLGCGEEQPSDEKLLAAAYRNDVAAARALIDDGADVNDHVNRLGWTALLEALILGEGGANTPRPCACWWRPARTSTSPTRTA